MSFDDSKLHLVVVANSVSGHGGAAKAARSQILALANRYQITVVTAEGEIAHANVNVVTAVAPKLYWLRRFSHSLREYLFCRRVCPALERIHRQKEIDFVIFHSHTSATIAGIKFRKQSSIPFAVVTHGDIFSRPAGSYDSLLTALYKWATVRSYKNTDLIIALSPFMQNAAIEHGAQPDRVSLIPNGVAVNKHAERIGAVETSRAEPGLKLLYVGRIAIEKDLTTLIGGFANAYERNDQLSLTIIGDGPLRSECEQACVELGLQSAVTFLGQLAPDELVHYYSAQDVFCITSISDPLPTVVLEAMQFGLPVIATQVDGLPFMVDHQVTGLLIPAGSEKEFASAVNYFYNNPDLLLEYGQAGRNKVNTQFNWTEIATQLEGAISRTIERTRG